MDEILWCIRWSAVLTPDLAMIPGRSVFLQSSQGRSLTATAEGMTDDIWEAWEHVEKDVDVDAVEGICSCITHEPRLENEVSQDRALYV